MRSFPIAVSLALAVSTWTPVVSQARLFWQTYGATAPAAGGMGCAWNLNSDYFVPRHCDSCRYDLFSPCKSAHTRSPACKYLHPVYGGYCTPYGPCHYNWRDHVYKRYCGCKPLKHAHGSWHLDKCRKHCPALRSGAPACDGGACAFAGAPGACTLDLGDATPCADPGFAYGSSLPIDWLPNVEPMGGESLGTIEAFPIGVGGTAASQGPSATGGASPASAGPALGLAPPSGGTAFSIPGLFGN
jgi:hypothetical protein